MNNKKRIDMKELSIEEKASRYDEAIKRVEDIRTGKCETPFMFTEGLFEHIFPALKESEDERIIGNIIATIHLYYGEPLEDEAKEMIAWLEKQGETFTKKDVDDAYLKGVCDAKHELEKQGEQKPVIVPRFRVGDIIRWKKADSVEYTIKEINDKGYINTADGIMDISQTDIEFELVEQKPADTEKGAKGNKKEIPNSAWTEDDEEEFKIAIDTLVEAGQRDSAHWLKSLKDRVQPKPTWSAVDEKIANSIWDSIDKSVLTNYGVNEDKAFEWFSLIKNRVQSQPQQQELSEEEEAIANALTKAANDNVLYGYIGKSKLLDWLKSLRPQSTWMPSDEQMNALNYVVNLMASSESPKENDYYYNVFKDLREQLKKLREE